MASFTLRPPSPFAVGASVAVYAASDWPVTQRPPSGSPPGSSVTTATVASDGSLAFSGLADATGYYAYQGGNYVGFTTPAAAATVTPGDGTVTNAKVAASAAIARSKLDFGSGLVNADIAAAAAIAKSKLAVLAIVNADVDAAAAIAYSKLNLAASVKGSDLAANHRPRVIGQYYGPEGVRSNVAFVPGNSIAGGLILVTKTETFDRAAVNVSSAGGAGALVRIGIYACDADGTPGALVLDCGEIDSTGTGLKELTINQQLTPGIYQLAAVCKTAGCSMVALAGDAQSGLLPRWTSTGALCAGIANTNGALSAGAMPAASGGVGAYTTNIPIVALRRSA